MRSRILNVFFFLVVFCHKNYGQKNKFWYVSAHAKYTMPIITSKLTKDGPVDPTYYRAVYPYFKVGRHHIINEKNEFGFSLAFSPVKLGIDMPTNCRNENNSLQPDKSNPYSYNYADFDAFYLGMNAYYSRRINRLWSMTMGFTFFPTLSLKTIERHIYCVSRNITNWQESMEYSYPQVSGEIEVLYSLKKCRMPNSYISLAYQVFVNTEKFKYDRHLVLRRTFLVIGFVQRIG